MFIVDINISRKKGEKKSPVKEAVFIENYGIQGDAHAGEWHRQVSLLGVESVDKMVRQGIKGLKSGDFAENITTSGIELHTLPVGTVLKIGDTLQRVTQIGKECHHHCAIYKQVGSCVMPTDGIFTEVLKGGVVKAGDHIEILDEKMAEEYV